MLEKQQQQILIREEKSRKSHQCILVSIAMFLIFMSVYFIGHYYFEFWNPSVIIAEFFILSAITIFICIFIIYKK